MLKIALESEIEDFISQHQDHQDDGSPRLVRNGYLPQRAIQTGIGELPVDIPRVRDRSKTETPLKFNSVIVPPYIRRSKSIETLLPLLYLKGLSTGDFQDALAPLLGDKAKNLSPGVISRLKTAWEDEFKAWCQKDLSLKKYVYLWADGIYLQARMEDSKDCILVIIGVNEYGQKELLAIESGYRESKESWKYVMQDLKNRGLSHEPCVVTGDGALGLWGALNEEFPTARHQRCWVHKTCNILDKLPKSLHERAKKDIQQIWMSETKAQALKAFNHFIKRYEAKYPKATHCLLKDTQELMTFYDFPAAHWRSLRTTNPIESTFATVRHRSKKSKGCFSKTTILTMVFKLCESAAKRWHKIAGFKQLGDVITGVKFKNGIPDNYNQYTNTKEAA